MLRCTLAGAAITLGVPLTGFAQTHPLVGTWTVRYPGGMQVQNGVPTVINFSGTLTVGAHGDSLVGVLVTQPSPGHPTRPDVRFATRSAPGTVVFVQHSTARININGAEQEATATSTWTLTVDGDRLEGTVARSIEGFDAPTGGPQPVTGERVKT